MTNQIIQNDNFVIQLFVIVDDILKLIHKFSLNGEIKKPGPKTIFSDSEIIVLILLKWKSTCSSWKSFHYEVYPYYYPMFQKRVDYKNFNELVPIKFAK